MLFSKPTTRTELEKSTEYAGQDIKLSPNCMARRFNTIKLSEKPRLNACPHCPKTFVKPSGLKAHIYSHTGEKPHQCPTEGCHRQFSLLSNLRRHIKTHKKADGKTRSLPIKRSTSKLLPLLSADQSNGTISYSEDPDEERRRQPQWRMDHGTMFDQVSSSILSLPISSMNSSIPIRNNPTGSTTDGNDNNSQTLFPSYSLLDWMDPIYFPHHNTIGYSKESTHVRSPTLCLPYAHDWMQLNCSQCAFCRQQNIDWIGNLRHQWQERDDPSQEQHQQQQDYQ